MIQFQDVSKKYSNGVFGVQQINITIQEGEFVFLIGPSGSGKTSLIKMLIRDEKPSEGKIYFDDVDITNISRGKVYKLRRQVGVIFQDFKLISEKTAYENVSFAMEAAGRKNAEIKEKVPYLLDVVGLKDKEKSFPRQLSGGEQQRVAIARAMANNPRILIADEPTGNLDPKSAWDIVQILTKINSWGTTVIMSTHGTEIVNALTKRVIQMEDGGVIRDDAEGEYEFTSDEPIPNELEEHLRKEETGAVERPTRRALQVDLTSKMGKGSESENEYSQDMDAIMQRLQEDDSESETVVAPETNENNNQETNQRLFINLKQKQEEQANSSPEESKLLQKLNNMPVAYLNLPEQLLKDLKEAGYSNVRQIVEDGPQKLSESSVIEEDEVVLVAQALEKIITNSRK